MNTDEKKVTITVTINPTLMGLINELYNNKSKYIERLIYQDLLKNKKLDDNFIL